jgi:hypothetical protein
MAFASNDERLHSQDAIRKRGEARHTRFPDSALGTTPILDSKYLFNPPYSVARYLFPTSFNKPNVS